jgi:hypothetical protein
MMMTEIVQGTPEWHALRLGKITASRIADVMATIKTGEAASRADYRMQLVCERLNGKREEGYTIKYAPHPKCCAFCLKSALLPCGRHDKEDGHSYVEGAIKLSRGDRDEVR